jgi:hypothetical protein
MARATHGRTCREANNGAGEVFRVSLCQTVNAVRIGSTQVLLSDTASRYRERQRGGGIASPRIRN